MGDSTDKVLKTFATDQRELRKLMAELDDSNGRPPPPGAERRGIRVPFTSLMRMWITQPGGNRQGFEVVGRNLSQTGASVLLGRFAYIGSLIELEYPVLTGNKNIVSGKIRFCRHVARQVHEIGLQFDEMVDLKTVVKLKPSEFKRLTSLVKTRCQLQGTCLLVDDLDLDRAIATHWLEGIGLTVVQANDAESALRIAAEHCPDIAIVDIWLGKENGTELIRKLKQNAYVGPIAAVSASEDVQDQRMAQEAGCEIFLQKPYEPRQIQDLAESLLMACENGAGVLRSTLAGRAELAELVEKYVAQLHGLSRELAEAWEKSDVDAIRRICHAIKGSAGNFGFPTITDQASGVLSLYAADAKDKKSWASSTMVRQLVHLMNRAAA